MIAIRNNIWWFVIYCKLLNLWSHCVNMMNGIIFIDILHWTTAARRTCYKMNVTTLIVLILIKLTEQFLFHTPLIFTNFRSNVIPWLFNIVVLEFEVLATNSVFPSWQMTATASTLKLIANPHRLSWRQGDSGKSWHIASFNPVLARLCWAQ